MIARIIIGIIVVLVIVYVCCGFRIVPQNNEGLVETLGKYSKTVKAGFIFVWPLFQRIRKVPLALQPLEISKYSIITKDNAEISTSLTLNYLVTDSYRYFYNNTDSVESMVQLIRGHLRDIIGRMDLNAALGSTKEINDQLFTATGDLTDIYGIKVVRVNVDELLPSAEIQRAMDKQLTVPVDDVFPHRHRAEGRAPPEVLIPNNPADKPQLPGREHPPDPFVKLRPDGDIELFGVPEEGPPGNHRV